MVRLVVATLACIALAGCLGPPSEDLDLASELVVHGGCGDALFYATDEGRSAVLQVLVTDVIAGNEPGDDPFFAVIPDARVETALTFGTHVGDAICTDVVEEEPIVDHQYVATAGDVEVTLVENADGTAAGTLVLQNAVFEHVEGRGDPLAVEALVIEAMVGWLPG